MNVSNIIFGPVPSRRLGWSLGINNLPLKICSYSCTYCRSGKTVVKQISRQTFYDPASILVQAKMKVEMAKILREGVNYISFVPNGEPTLDENLGCAIDLLKPLGVKIAVISNGSLTWQKDVRNDLAKADWVSLKLDTVSNETWKRLNRPMHDLKLSEILEAILQFRSEFTGELVTETMLVKGVNDRREEIEGLSEFLTLLRPSVAYLSTPTCPPQTAEVLQSPIEEFINIACQIMNSAVNKVECLSGYEGHSLSLSGVVEEDLLKIIAVYPMQEETVKIFLEKAGADWAVVEKLKKERLLGEQFFAGKKFYIRL